MPPVLGQPEAVDDVAALAVAALGAPVNGCVELAGPERFRLDELTRRVLGANGDPRRVTADGRARYLAQSSTTAPSFQATTHASLGPDSRTALTGPRSGKRGTGKPNGKEALHEADDRSRP